MGGSVVCVKLNLVELEPVLYLQFAPEPAEDSGSMIETQDTLDHEHLGTTRAYVQTIAVKKDKFSGSIRSRMEALDSTRS